jgi:hypothetical protein
MNSFAKYGIIRTSNKEKKLPNFDRPRYYIDKYNDIYQLGKTSYGDITRRIYRWSTPFGKDHWAHAGFIVNYKDYLEFLKHHQRIRKDYIWKYVDKLRMLESLSQ